MPRLSSEQRAEDARFAVWVAFMRGFLPGVNDRHLELVYGILCDLAEGPFAREVHDAGRD